MRPLNFLSRLSIVVAALILWCAAKAQKSDPAAPVTVKIAWEAKDFDGQMKIYEVGGKKKPKIWEMNTAKTEAELPVAGEIPNSRLILRRGTNKTFVLVMKNDSDQPKFFFAAPHVATPVEYSLGFKFKCLCVNHAFKVPPKQIWYRVVNFNLSKDFIGEELEVRHTLVGITEERMKSFKMPLGAPGAGHDHDQM